jgi:RNA polymerase sigma-70 factor (ECF subfamily)
VGTDTHGEHAAAGRRADILAWAVERAKAGERDAIRFLYTRFADDVNAYVLGLARDAREAEAVTQLTFARLAGTIGAYEARDLPFQTWILRVAHELVARDVRPSPVAEAGATHAGSEQAQASALKAALADLPAEQREVLVLRHVVGLSPVEIASRMERSEASIHGLHHSARGALKAKLRERNCAPAV